MSRYHFTLRVPADLPYQALAGGVAGRFLEGLGVEKTVCGAFSAEVGEAVAELATGTEAIDLSFSRSPSGVAVTIAAGGRRRIVSHSV